MYKLEHDKKGRRKGREAEEGKGKEGECVLTGKKWGFFFFSIFETEPPEWYI